MSNFLNKAIKEVEAGEKKASLAQVLNNAQKHGALHINLTLGVRQWTCEECGQVNERDLNASVNIRDETLRILTE